MLNAIPIIGWLLSLFFSISLAVPFWLIWTVGGIGKTYFYFLPPVYQEVGFWASVGLFVVIGILKAVLVPRLAWVDNSSKSES